jgi:quercetin dioxygenase-like cupin family protein
MPRRGEHCGIILKGQLKGFIGTQGITLEEGDSINFDCTLPHLWENAGDGAVEAIWAISPPSF